MDDALFDRLARAAARPLSRRVLGALTGGALAGLSLAAETEAKKKKKKKKKKASPAPPVCTPEVAAATCAGGKCGNVANNCNQQVNCGLCDTYVFDTQWGGSGSGDGKLRQPRGVAVDSAGNVYVADTNNNRIQKFSNGGQYLDQWGEQGSDVELSLPYSVAVDQQGSIYVADYGNNRIVKLSANGAFLTAWETAADEEDTLDGPWAVGVDGSNSVYVADFGNHRVVKFSSDGGFIEEVDAFFVSATGVASNGTLFVVDAHANTVYRFPGTPIGGPGSGDGQFTGPSSVVLDGDGSILVTDSQNDRFQKFDSDGNFLTAVNMPAVGIGASSLPLGIAVDGAGNVLVANFGNDSIQKFRPAGSAFREAAEAPSRATSGKQERKRREKGRQPRR